MGQRLIIGGLLCIFTFPLFSYMTYGEDGKQGGLAVAFVCALAGFWLIRQGTQRLRK